MNTSSRFIVATHILTAMATFKRGGVKQETFKSDFISDSVNTNPVVIRRILGMLREAGLVNSQTGPEGGSSLARDPERISLLDIYSAVEDCCLFHLHYNTPSQACPIGYNIQDTLQAVFSDAADAVKKVLAEKTVADIADEIMKRAGIKKGMAAGMTLDEIRKRFRFKKGKLISTVQEAPRPTF